MRLLPVVGLIVFMLLPVAAASGAPEIDPISASCLACHDGTNAPRVRYCLAEQKDKGCGGHIISASYAELAARDETLVPESMLPLVIVLYEGRITCVTCHGSDPHLGETLAMDNRGSALCRSCHLK